MTDWVQARKVRKIKHFCLGVLFFFFRLENQSHIDLYAPWHPIDQQNAMPFTLYATNLRNWNVHIELVRCRQKATKEEKKEKKGENANQATLWSVSIWNTHTKRNDWFPMNSIIFVISSGWKRVRKKSKIRRKANFHSICVCIQDAVVILNNSSKCVSVESKHSQKKNIETNSSRVERKYQSSSGLPIYLMLDKSDILRNMKRFFSFFMIAELFEAIERACFVKLSKINVFGYCMWERGLARYKWMQLLST